MFYVVGCPNCQKLQTTNTSKTFKCKFCGKTAQIKNLKKLFSSKDAPEAIEWLKNYKEEKSLSKDKARGDFFSYSP